MTTIKPGSVAYKRIIKYYPNFDFNDPKQPIGICALCRKKLEKVDNGKMSVDDLPTPIDFSGLDFGGYTGRQLMHMTDCRCSMCLLTREKQGGKLGNTANDSPYQLGRPVVAAAVQFPAAGPARPGQQQQRQHRDRHSEHQQPLTHRSEQHSQSLTMLTMFHLTGGRSLANIPPSERPKAKPSRKIDGKGAKKSQLQAALQQHSQQLAQLQQLQQLNQQLQHQVEC